MSKSTSRTAIRCMYCNSESHVSERCNSNMRGRRQLLIKIGQSFMLDEKVVDFTTFALNELRFIASIYKESQKKTIRSAALYKHVGLDSKRLLSPIPFTYTKTRMRKELEYRWNIYRNIHNNKKREKPECDDCPICMETMANPIWNVFALKWENVYNKQGTADEQWPNGIKTICGHEFCGSCWERHLSVNTKRDYMSHQQYVCCPICRHKLEY